MPSLRPLIADGMRGLAHTQARDLPELARLSRGAGTLEWCDERDPDSDPCPDPWRAEQIEELEEKLQYISDALDEWVVDGMKQPAAFRDRLRALIEA